MVEARCGNACGAALAAATSALARFETMVHAPYHAEAGRPLGMGLALHVGDVFYGNIGARDRLDFTVIGPAVNLAARVQGQCSALGTPLLVTDAFAAHARRDDLGSLGTHALKGIVRAPELFTLAALMPRA